MDFKKINLIFGWNGTGKTTLSRVLRCYELGEKCKKLSKYKDSEYEIGLQTGSTLTESGFLPKQQIRVFNKDFIEDNIFQDKEIDGGNITPLYYLGSEKIELTKERKQIDGKKIELSNLEKEIKIKDAQRVLKW